MSMPRARIDFFELVLENEWNDEICVLQVPNASKATIYNRICIAYNIVEFLKSTIYDFTCQMIVKNDWGFSRHSDNTIQELMPTFIYDTITYHYHKTNNPGIYHIQFKGEPRTFPATGYTIDMKDLDPIPYEILATISQHYPELEAVLQQDEYKKELEKNEKILVEDLRVQKVINEQREHLRKMLQGLSDSFDKISKCSDKTVTIEKLQEMLSSDCTKRRSNCPLYHCPSCDICYKNRAALVAHIDSTHLGPNGDTQSTSLDFNKCHLCNISFTKAKFLTQHMKMHSIKSRVELEQNMLEQKTTYTCVHCGLGFINRLDMSTHMEAEHLTNTKIVAPEPREGIFTCRRCDKVFYLIEKLCSHTCTEIVNRPHMASSFGQNEPQLSKDKKYEGDGEYYHRWHEYTYKKNESLNSEMKSLEMMTPVERREEEVKQLKQEEKPSSPIAIEHVKRQQMENSSKEEFQPSADGLYHCQGCEYSSKDVKSLNAHMIVHTMLTKAEQESRANLRAALAAATEAQRKREQHTTPMEEDIHDDKRANPTVQRKMGTAPLIFPTRPQFPCRVYSENPNVMNRYIYHTSPAYPTIDRPPYRKIGKLLEPMVIVPQEGNNQFGQCSSSHLPSDEPESLTEILKMFGAALDAEKSPKKSRDQMSDEELVNDIELQQHKLMNNLTLNSKPALIALSKPPRPGRIIAQEIAASPMKNEEGGAMPVQVQMAFTEYQDGRLSYFDMRDLLDCLKEIQMEQGMKTALDIAIDSLELLEIQKRHERKRSNSGDDDCEYSAKNRKINAARIQDLCRRATERDAEMARSAGESQKPSCSKEKQQVQEYTPPKVSEKKPINIVDPFPKKFFYRKNEVAVESKLPEDIMLVQIHNAPMKTYGKWCKHIPLPVFEHYLKFEVTRPEVDFEPFAIQLGATNVQEFYVHSCCMIKENDKKAFMSMHLYIVGLSDWETVSLVLQLVDKKNENRPLSNYIYLSGKYDKELYSKVPYYNENCRMGKGHMLPIRQEPFFNIKKADTESIKNKLANWRSKLAPGSLVVYKESDLVSLGNWCSHVAMPVFKKTIRVRTIDGKAFKPEKWTMQIVKNANLNTVIMPFVPKNQQTQYCRTMDMDLLVIVEDPSKKASAVIHFNKKNSTETIPYVFNYTPGVDELAASNMYFKDCDQPKPHPWPAQLKTQRIYPSKAPNVVLSKPTAYHGTFPPNSVTVAYPHQLAKATVEDVQIPEEAVIESAKMEVVKGDSFSSHTDMHKMDVAMMEELKEKSPILKLSDICEKTLEDEKEMKVVENSGDNEPLLSPADTLEFDFVEKEEAELTEAEVEDSQPKEEEKREEADGNNECDTSECSDFEIVGGSDTEEI